MKHDTVLETLDRIDPAVIGDTRLAAEVSRLKALRKQRGFTLLELLVVVAILAAIAGTAAIALQDTDARASAAAHVAMMDELNKGIHTYRVLNKNEFPNNFDALLETATAGDATVATFPINELIAIEDVGRVALTTDAAQALADIGITQLQYIDNTVGDDAIHGFVTAPGDGCASANVTATIASRANAVVANNIFMTPAANGCGVGITLDPAVGGEQVLVWTGGYERLLGARGVPFDTAGVPTALSAGAAITAAAADTPVFMVVGIGPSSTLFDASALGGMTTVPVYRHVSELQYGRFVALFQIGEFTGTAAAYDVTDQVTLVGIIDGAGDTKEEELGEWDGTRNTEPAPRAPAHRRDQTGRPRRWGRRTMRGTARDGLSRPTPSGGVAEVAGDRQRIANRSRHRRRGDAGCSGANRGDGQRFRWRHPPGPLAS